VKALRVAALLLILSGVAGAGTVLAGCGSASGVAASPAALKLQREDLIAVTRGLHQAAVSAQREMAAARIAWPLLVGGFAAPNAPAPPRRSSPRAGWRARSSCRRRCAQRKRAC
jgi:hypothetical protein